MDCSFVKTNPYFIRLEKELLKSNNNLLSPNNNELGFEASNSIDKNNSKTSFVNSNRNRNAAFKIIYDDSFYKENNYNISSNKFPSDINISYLKKQNINQDLVNQVNLNHNSSIAQNNNHNDNECNSNISSNNNKELRDNNKSSLKQRISNFMNNENKEKLFNEFNTNTNSNTNAYTNNNISQFYDNQYLNHHIIEEEKNNNTFIHNNRNLSNNSKHNLSNSDTNECNIFLNNLKKNHYSSVGNNSKSSFGYTDYKKPEFYYNSKIGSKSNNNTSNTCNITNVKNDITNKNPHDCDLNISENNSNNSRVVQFNNKSKSTNRLSIMNNRNTNLKTDSTIKNKRYEKNNSSISKFTNMLQYNATISNNNSNINSNRLNINIKSDSKVISQYPSQISAISNITCDNNQNLTINKIYSKFSKVKQNGNTYNKSLNSRSKSKSSLNNNKVTYNNNNNNNSKNNNYSLNKTPNIYRIVQKVKLKEKGIKDYFYSKQINQKHMIFSIIKKFFFINKKLKTIVCQKQQEIFDIIRINYLKEMKTNTQIIKYFDLKRKSKVFTSLQLHYLSRIYARKNRLVEIKNKAKQFYDYCFNKILIKSNFFYKKLNLFYFSFLYKSRILVKLSIKKKKIFDYQVKNNILNFFQTSITCIVSKEHDLVLTRKFHIQNFVYNVKAITKQKQFFFSEIIRKKFAFFLRLIKTKLNKENSNKRKLGLSYLYYQERLSKKTMMGFVENLIKKQSIMKFFKDVVNINKERLKLEVLQDYNKLKLEKKLILEAERNLIKKNIKNCFFHLIKNVSYSKKKKLSENFYATIVKSKIVSILRTNREKGIRFKEFIKTMKTEYMSNLKITYINLYLNFKLPYYYLLGSKKKSINCNDDDLSLHLNDVYYNKSVNLFIKLHCYNNFRTKVLDLSKHKKKEKHKLLIFDYYYNKKLKINLFKCIVLNKNIEFYNKILYSRFIKEFFHYTSRKIIIKKKMTLLKNKINNSCYYKKQFIM